MSNADEFNIARQLVDGRRTLTQAAMALLEAADLDVEESARAAKFAGGLKRRQMQLDILALQSMLTGLVAYLAHTQDKTPREVLEQAFQAAPPDEWWRERIG